MRIAAAVALIAIAVVAVLLARDVNASRRALAQGDAVYAITPGRATWTATTSLGGAAESVLGTRGDIQLRRALQRYAVAVSTPNRLDTAVEAQTLRSQAANALASVAHGAHASQAQTLLGVLAFDSSADDAIADFTDAVRTDPSNAAAKYNLELLLRLAAARGSREGAGPGGTFGRGGRRGAGGGVPGSGY